MLVHFIFTLLSCSHVMLTNSLSSLQPLCHDDERTALLEFKQSFLIENFASSDPSAYPKIATWNLGKASSECCLWDGLECDEDTGHVIGLDLSSSFLYGSINSSSSLFYLSQLRSLNLSDNHLNYSKIPARVGQLSRLESLNLSDCTLFGQIPQEISNLSKLISLDLSSKSDFAIDVGLLKLEEPSLEHLIQNLTTLQVLSLSQVNLSSKVPNILANFTSLIVLKLHDCELYGEFPIGIFHLPMLQVLDVGWNRNLRGHLPKFHQNNLQVLKIRSCNFMGSFPSSFGNLIHLTTLYLDDNSFSGTLSWLGNQSTLSRLDLSSNNFYGEIPALLGNLTQLTLLSLRWNQLVGEIPTSISNLTQLTILNLAGNQLHGPIPQSIFELRQLQHIALSYNNLSGTLEVGMLLNLINLTALLLSGVNLLPPNTLENATLPKFQLLILDFCNLIEFPEFLKYQNEITLLALRNNKLHGIVPKWIWDIGRETLLFLDLSGNILNGFEQFPDNVLPLKKLFYLNLRNNMLQGSLPIPEPAINYYDVSNNSLKGEISPSFCNASSLNILHLNNNKLSGTIPPCLTNFKDNLRVLSLGNNNFHGFIPQIYTKGCSLEVIDLSTNNIAGQVPKSLANCKHLEQLNLGNNLINDTFPLFLGSLPNLKILVLSSNQFHGTINSLSETHFPSLHIIDFSFNNFTGELPSKFFQNWNASQIHNVGKITYLETTNVTLQASSGELDLFMIGSYPISLTLRNKGSARLYEKVQSVFTAIDLSGNNFKGEIPPSIGNIYRLQLLNLSNNKLTGTIPSSLANMKMLEALDLSQNQLTGQIPQQLRQLTFLEFLNLSNNHLKGNIPQGNQFDTFDNSSFEGNPGLCGEPLSKKCESFPKWPLPPPTFEEKDSEVPTMIDWIVRCTGYASGLVAGCVIGCILFDKKLASFARNFAHSRRNKRRNRKRGRRN